MRLVTIAFGTPIYGPDYGETHATANQTPEPERPPRLLRYDLQPVSAESFRRAFNQAGKTDRNQETAEANSGDSERGS
jgi:hypothetical protein